MSKRGLTLRRLYGRSSLAVPKGTKATKRSREMFRALRFTNHNLHPLKE